MLRARVYMFLGLTATSSAAVAVSKVHKEKTPIRREKFDFRQTRRDVRMETYSESTLSQYGLTKPEFYRQASLSFYDDPELRYLLPFQRDHDAARASGKYDSLLADFIKAGQKTYSERSIDRKNLQMYPNSKTFLFFCEKNTADEELECLWDYAGTITVCEPEDNGKGYHDIGDTFVYIQEAMDRGVKLYGRKAMWIDFLSRVICQQLNKELLLRKITSCTSLKQFWWLEQVSTSVSHQGKGIGSYMFKSVVGEYAQIKSQELGCEGFAFFYTPHPRAVSFYERNGCRLVTCLKFPKIMNDKGEEVDFTMYMLLYHPDQKKLFQMRDELSTVLKKEYSVLPVFKAALLLLQAKLFGHSSF